MKSKENRNHFPVFLFAIFLSLVFLGVSPGIVFGQCSPCNVVCTGWSTEAVTCENNANGCRYFGTSCEDRSCTASNCRSGWTADPVEGDSPTPFMTDCGQLGGCNNTRTCYRVGCYFSGCGERGCGSDEVYVSGNGCPSWYDRVHHCNYDSSCVQPTTAPIATATPTNIPTATSTPAPFCCCCDMTGSCFSTTYGCSPAYGCTAQPWAACTPTLVPTATATTIPTATATLTPTATNTPTATATLTPTATPTFTRTVAPTSTNTPTTRPSITPTPTCVPLGCNASCGGTGQCGCAGTNSCHTDLSGSHCRNPLCNCETDCNCGGCDSHCDCNDGCSTDFCWSSVSKCRNVNCPARTSCYCGLSPTPTNTPTNTLTPTATRRPAPTNTPTSVPTRVPTSTLIPTASPIPTSSQLCCLKEPGSLSSHCWQQGVSYSGGVYWPVGVPCGQYCSGKPTPGTWCGSGTPPSCRSCKCGNNGSLTPSSFNIGPGETQELTASYIPGSSTNQSSISYRWYAFPAFEGGGITAQCVDGCKIDHLGRDIGEWSWSRFKPSASGYLAQIELLIDSETDGYALAFVGEDRDDKMVRLSDSRGEGEIGDGGYEDKAQLYGARERHFGVGEKKYLFDFDYLNQYVSADTTYRLYFKPRSVEKFNVGAFWVSVFPSDKLETGSFSDPSGCRGQTQCTVTYTAPLTAPIGTRFKILAEISDDKSLFADNCGSGNCLSNATVGPNTATGWFQTEDIDVYSGGNIKSSIPSTAIPNSYFSLRGGGESSGVVVAKLGVAAIDFGDKEKDPSADHWLAKGAPYQGKIMDFDYLVNRLKINTTVKDFPHGCLPATGTYYTEGEQAVDCDWNIHSGTKITVFVNGGVAINKNIAVEQGGFLAIIAKGDITFGGNVVKAQGLFVSSRNLVINGSTESPYHAFEGRGSFIGWKGIQLNRNLGTGRSKTDPSELFLARPDLWLNFPQEFSYSLSVREELMP